MHGLCWSMSPGTVCQYGWREKVSQSLRFLVDYSVDNTKQGLIGSLCLAVSLRIIVTWFHIINSLVINSLRSTCTLKNGVPLSESRYLGMSNRQMMLSQMKFAKKALLACFKVWILNIAQSHQTDDMMTRIKVIHCGKVFSTHLVWRARICQLAIHTHQVTL